MPRIEITTPINAPAHICFDVARDIGFHTQSMAHTGERAVAGVTTGLIGPGQRVTWEGRHFGVRQRFTSEITRFEPPGMFRDEMVQGAFRSFAHDHIFEPQPDGATLMRDILDFRAPLGPLGAAADHLLLRRYLRRLLADRAAAIRSEAERRARAESN